MSPLVSVIMPTYNRAKIIEKSIQSVLDQNFSNFELIVVDDGSTDNTSEIISAIKDSRIKYFKKENSGPAIARNYGINKSSGKYIAFIDSDDLWYKEHLFKLINYLEDHPKIGMVYTKLLMVNEKGVEQGTYGSAFDRNALEYNCLMMPSSVLLRRSSLDQVGLFDENPAIRGVHEDWDFFLRFSDHFRIEYLDVISGVGMKHSGGLLLKALVDKSFFSGKYYIINKRFKVFKESRKKDKLAPFDGYFFCLFKEIYWGARFLEKINKFKAQDILRIDILPIFKELKSKDKNNLEAWLVLALIYCMLKEFENVTEMAHRAKSFLSQKLKIDDKQILNLILSSLKGAALVLDKAGEKELAMQFLEKVKEFPQV